MKKPSRPFILGFVLALVFLQPLRAQTSTSPAADAKVDSANPTSGNQAPDDVMKKLSDLVHAGKYSEAQQLTAGLLMAYPNDQRLIKGKILLDKLAASAGSANAPPSSNRPRNGADSAQPATNVEQLIGMDKVDYNALIELTRQAQQTTDLAQQEKLLQQFMRRSGVFLQKHPTQILLWQLRAASAISLDDPVAGYEAGQKLLESGAADSNDPNLQRLLAQLKNKSWLDKEWAETTKKLAEITKTHGWMLGTWSETFTSTWTKFGGTIDRGIWGGKKDQWNSGSADYKYNEEFYLSKSSPVIEVYRISGDGVKSEEPSYRGTLLDSGEVRWEGHIGGHPGWEQATSCEIDEHRRKMTAVFRSWNDERDENASQPETHFFTKIDAIRNPAPMSAVPNTNSSTPAGNPTAELQLPAVNSSTSVNNLAPLAASDMAVLHVYRLHHLYAAAQKPYICVDGEKITPIANSQVVRMLLAPGKHNISASKKYVENEIPVNDLEMAAGGEYWIRVDIVAGAWESHSKLYVVPSAQAQSESKHMEEIRIDHLSMNAALKGTK
jgi:hypothetical protein